MELVASKMTEHSSVEEALKTLRDDFTSYKSEVNVIGGVLIGVVICLILAYIYLYVLVRSIPKRFDETLDRLDPLRKFTVYNKHTMMREQLARSTNSLPNKLNSESSTPELRTPTGSARFDFPKDKREDDKGVVLRVPNAIPKRLLSNVDSPTSPMHFDGNTPSAMKHFDFPPKSEQYDRQISQEVRKGPMSPY